MTFVLAFEPPATTSDTSPALDFDVDLSFTLAFDNVMGSGSGSSDGYPIASQPEAAAGTSNTSLMTPLRTHQAVDARIATEAEAAAGISTTTLITPATLQSAVPAALWFFDRAGDLLSVTVPAGIDVIYRLGYAKRGDHEITRFKRKVDAPTTAPVNNLAWEKDAAGVFFINDMPRIDVRTLGVIADGQSKTGGAMTIGSNRLTFTLGGGNFTAADVGKLIQVNGAGPLTLDDGGAGILSAQMVDYLTGKIGAVVNANICDIVDAGGAPLNASQTVLATEGKLVRWVTDSTVQLKNVCRAAATTGKFMYVPGSQYYAASTASICTINGYSNIRVEGDGSTSWLMYFTNQTPGDGTMFYIVGAFIDRTTLTAPAFKGDDIITVADTSALPVDSYLDLKDLARPIYLTYDEEPLGTVLGWQGEIVRVREIISPTQLRLHAQLEEDYTAAASPKQTKVTTIAAVADVTIRNLRLEHAKPITQTNTGIISSSRTVRMTLENVYFPYSAYAFVNNMGIDTRVHNCRFEWAGTTDGTQQDGDHDYVKGYCMVIAQGQTGCLIDDIVGRNVRHLITASSSNDIPPRHVHMTNVVVNEGRNLIDTHPGADHWIISDCHVTGGMWVDEVDQMGYGFQPRGNQTIMQNCSAHGVAYGLQIPGISGTKVVNFKAINCDVGVGIFNSRDVELNNTLIINPRVMGLQYHYTDTSGAEPNALQRLGKLTIDGFRVIGNPTRNSLVEDYYLPAPFPPSGMQFGYVNSTPAFVSQWHSGITIKNWDLSDCTTPFAGADPEAVYGPGIVTGATAQNMRRQDVAGTAIAMLTSGTMFFSEIPLIARRTIERLDAFGAAPVGQTNLWLGLFDNNRKLMAKTVDALAVAPTPGVETWLALDRIHHPRADGRYYIGICQVAGTPSTVYGRSMPTAFAALGPGITAGNANAGLTTPASWPAISSATSTTLLTADLIYPAKKLTTQVGKAFTPDMRVKIALTADPTNYFLGRVTTYISATLWVECDAIAGAWGMDPATLNAWTITADATASAITPTGNIAFVMTG